MRGAGMVHRPAAPSISVQAALRTSPERVAVSTRNSKASFTIGRALDAPTASIADATSRCGKARMCCTTSCWGPRTGSIRSHGLSIRNSIATAHSKTARMRWRSRRAVSAFACQMGARISSTLALVTSDTGIFPMRGRVSGNTGGGHPIPNGPA